MATEYIIQESTLNALAEQILRLKGTDTAQTPAEQIEFLESIQKQVSSSITANGATVTIPAGYYSSAATKTIASGKATTPATTITASPSISVDTAGKITATTSATKSITPTVTAGYVSSGTAGTVTVSGTSTSQMTTQGAKTVTPTKSSQTAVAAGRYTTGAVTVAAIPAEYIKTDEILDEPDNSLASSDEILESYSAFANGNEITGAMLNHGAVSQTLNAGGSYTIPQGYHNGSGKVTANSLASQTSATAATGDIVSGKTAYVNGSKITGTIATKSSSDLTASGATVTVPAGYYSTQASKSVGTVGRASTIMSTAYNSSEKTITVNASNNQGTGYVTGSNATGSTTITLSISDNVAKMATGTTEVTATVASGSATTPATTITATPSISINSSGKITASYSGSQSVTPTVSKGWVTSGIAGTISTSGSATKQLTTKAATTYTPSTSNQTISSGTYLTGTQTIKGDTNLKSSNIKSGVSIFGVAGTYTGSGTQVIPMPPQQLEVGDTIVLTPLALDSEAGTPTISDYTGDSDDVTIDGNSEWLEVTAQALGSAVVTLTYTTDWWSATEGYGDNITRTLSYPIIVYAAEVEDDPPSVTNWNYGYESGSSSMGSYSSVTNWSY